LPKLVIVKIEERSSALNPYHKFTTLIVIPHLSLAGPSPRAEGEETAPPHTEVRPTAAVERRKHIVCLIAEETSDCRLSRESPSAAEQFPHLSRAGWRPRAKGSE